jgi:hypothetical protein
MPIQIGTPEVIPFQVPQADLIANVTQDFVCPFDGTLEGLRTIVQTAVTTGGTVGLQVNGNAVNMVAGNTIANAAAKGTRSFFRTGIANPDRRVVAKGDRISVTFSGFATAGAITGTIVIQQQPQGEANPF